MKHRLILAALATVLFTAQAEAQRQRSEALEIARATVLKGAVRDVSRDDLEEALAGSPDMSVNYALDALGVATGVFDQATSLSRLGEAGVFAALAFFSPSLGPEDGLYLFGWMPRADAATAQDAREKFRAMLIVALEQSLPDHKLSSAPPDWYPDPNNRTGSSYDLRLDGPACAPCGIKADLWSTTRARLPGKARAPEVLGQYPAWRWGGSSTRGMYWGYPMVEGVNVEERFLFFQEVSRYLPAWAYIYLPPHEMLLDFPLMFNEGEALYFIEPATAEDR